MLPLRLYIVEDEPLITSTIEIALSKHGYKIVGDCENVETALEDIRMLNPDLVLIDIQLEGQKDGIDLALALDDQEQPYVFLTSQTDPQTINRVKQTQPLGYIVKPFTESGLRSNIELSWHNYVSKKINYLLFRSEGKLHKINQDHIYYLKAFDNYCYVITTSKTYLVPHTLKYTVEELDQTQFVKTHRSFWVNIKHITTVNKLSVSVNGESIPMSLGKKSEVLKRLNYE